MGGSLVYRYDPGRLARTGRAVLRAPSPCAGYVDALSGAGRLDDARLAFEKMLTDGNHVGLFSKRSP
jgi:pentatricopeptide repeat protein